MPVRPSNRWIKVFLCLVRIRRWSGRRVWERRPWLQQQKEHKKDGGIRPCVAGRGKSGLSALHTDLKVRMRYNSVPQCSSSSPLGARESHTLVRMSTRQLNSNIQPWLCHTLRVFVELDVHNRAGCRATVGGDKIGP